MPSTRLKPTAGDYVVLALSPALIIALIVSLVFFLIEILYAGAYPGSLRWTLFFYVFGAVLVARLALTPETSSLSGLYGGILGLVAWLALLRFVKYPPDNPLADVAWLINAGLILLIWWCAYRLTWDCTYVDETVGAAGLGVLQAAGLEEKKAQPQPAEPPPEAAKAEEKDNTLAGWLERWRRYSESKNQRRTPGVWVVWFGLASLVLFGLGQALIPPEAVGRRRYVFWLMIIHVASGLGLLSTTCFLGLRNYLREKKLQMPATMVGVWMGTAAILVGCLLALGALLPRPRAEYKVVDIDPLGAEKRDASKKNLRDGDAGEGEGKGKGESKDRQNSDGKSGNGKDKKSDQQQSGNRDRGQGDKDRGGSRGQKDGKDKQEQGKSGGPNKEQNAQGQGGSKKDETEQTRKELQDVWKNAPKALNNPFLRKVVFIAVGIVVAFFVLRAVLRHAANFTNWADNLLKALDRLWQSILALFGRKSEEEERGEPAGELSETLAQGRPFADYANPFASGRAGEMSPAQMARYTFAAFEAWARENDLARQRGETPLEFAQKVALVIPALEREAEALAHLLTRALYAPGELPASAVPTLKQFWDKLLAVEAAPLSA